VDTPGGSYPMSAQDVGRQGWWLDVSGSHDYTLFISKTGKVTPYPAVNGNCYYSALILCESKNLLIVANGGNGSDARALGIRDLTTGITKSVNMVGTLPAGIRLADGVTIQYRPELLGLQWVEELGCIVGIDQLASPPTICKITPPATNPATSPWTISSVTLAHWDSGDASGSTSIRSANNGNFSKFRWVKTIGAFVLATSSTTKPQVFSL
jgi:hypothetical protein